MANITKDFLEMALGQQVDSFECSSGSNVGEGFTSLLYSVDVTLKGQQEICHIIIKCFPVHPSRQEWVTQRNMFLKELSVYNQVIAALIEFQSNLNQHEIIKPPYPELVYGRAIDYSAIVDTESKLCTDPLDNCLIMPDLHKTGGFRIADRFVGLDLDHCKLTVAGLAKIHALSWAYKLHSNVSSLSQKFTFLNNGNVFDQLENHEVTAFFDNSLTLFNAVIELCSKDQDEKDRLTQSVQRVYENVHDTAAIYFCDIKVPSDPSLTRDNILRVPGIVKENEEPWLVLNHGDAWMNNVMFRYDEGTGKPVETIFVDLQMAREGDPMNDLAYSLFTSTTAELRKLHLNELLKLYVETFMEVCDHFNVTPLPGFQLAEVERRFHRAKAFGFLVAFMCLSGFMNDNENSLDFEKMEGTDVIAHFKEMSKVMARNKRFQHRVMGLVRELNEQGVI